MNLHYNHDKEWDNLRNYLRCQLAQIMLAMPGGGTIVKECPKCQYGVPFIVEKVHSVEMILDVVMSHYRRFHHELALQYEGSLRAKVLSEIELTPLQKTLLELTKEGILSVTEASKLSK